MFFLGVYLVRMNERFNQMIQDLVEIISGMDSTIPITDVKSKTWDQKYEDELEEISRRMRQDRKSTRLNSSHTDISRMPSSA